MGTYLTLIKTFLYGKSSQRFVAGVVLSLGFSISVILCTLGLMNGFDKGLKSSLKIAQGDFTMFSRQGFFVLDDETKNLLENKNVKISPFLKTEGFFLFKNFSKGVVIHGVSVKEHNITTGLDLKLEPGEVVIGEELASQSNIKKGDLITLTLAQGKGAFKGLPKMFRFRVGQIIKQGVYDKDLRFIYLNKNELQDMLAVGKKINMISLKSLDINPNSSLEEIENIRHSIDQNLDALFILQPFWNEYSTLIEAVELEKVSITLILQIIVIVAIFNVLAFVIFLNEKKSKEIFLFQTLGMGPRKIFTGWLYLIILMWAFSCILAYIFKLIFSFALKNFEAFSLPGDIYTLTNIDLYISPETYGLVFALAFTWLMLCSLGLFYVLSRKSLLTRLRMEYS